MAYNLGSRSIREEFFADLEEPLVKQSDQEVNDKSSDSGTDSSASFEQNDSDDDVDMEDASLNERLL